MKVDEAIKHAEEVAEEKEKKAKIWLDGGNEKIGNSCLTCAEEHRQLAEWLKDYKRLLEQKTILDKIREEIEKAYCKVKNDYDKGRNYGLFMATQLIDKYKAESEGSEDNE